jgi:hypothetical protein
MAKAVEKTASKLFTGSIEMISRILEGLGAFSSQVDLTTWPLSNSGFQ